jgi:hypothetical protein
MSRRVIFDTWGLLHAERNPQRTASALEKLHFSFSKNRLQIAGAVDDAYYFDLIGQNTVEDQVALEAGDWPDADAVEEAVLELTDAADSRRALEQGESCVERVKKTNGGLGTLILQEAGMTCHIDFGSTS